MKKEKQKKNRPVASIGWKLIVYFAIFVAVALLVMWVFQVYLLNNFYELIKRREMAHSATELANYIETENLDIHAYDLSNRQRHSKAGHQRRCNGANNGHHAADKAAGKIL